MNRKFRDQTVLSAYATERFDHQVNHAGRLAEQLHDDALTRPGPEGKWSIAGLFDHMALMNRLYAEKLESSLRNTSTSPGRDWAPTIAGRTLRWAVNTRLKLPTVGMFKPTDPSSDPHAVQRFIASVEDLAGILKRSSEMHWKSVRVASPASELVSLNLGDVFLVLADHMDRHLRQIEERLDMGTT